MVSEKDYKELEALGEYFEKVPFDVTHRKLYTAPELYQNYDPENEETFATCHDSLVYKHFMNKGKAPEDAREAQARSLHDHMISIALNKFLKKRDPLMSVGIMGGHGLPRTDSMYKQIVMISKQLTESGYLIITGGGPGAMEAAHLGAWMADRSNEEVEEAMSIMQTAPMFTDEGWLKSAFEVMKRFPQEKYQSLGIPTWLYGHEPSTPLATHIAKYFQNSIREDGILTLAFGGIIYTPGSAGTMQEIFQDAVQNHYLLFGFSSPMVFMGKKFWTEEIPIYPFMQRMLENGKYKNLILSLTDDPDEVVNEILKFKKSAESE